MLEPTFEDVLRARKLVSSHLPRTPLYEYPELSTHFGCRVLVKHENHLPVGSFKVRGGANLVGSLAPAERARGIVSATRGNHGLSLAWSARRFGARALLVVPHGNNPEKNAFMRALGVELVEFGRDFDEAREHALELAARDGLRLVHPANEPLLIAGVGTWALELFEDAEAPDALFVPVGLGSGICGASLARGALSPATQLVGVQAERAPAVYLSWREKRPVSTASADTFADGLATRVPAELTQRLIDRHVDDFVVLGEAELAQGVRDCLRYTHNLAEGAGAAALAALWKLRARFAGQRVAVVLSGGNIDVATLRRVLDGETRPG